jgi:hypothetical protein
VNALLVQSTSMFNISFFGRPSRNHCKFDNIHRTKLLSAVQQTRQPGSLAGDRAPLSLWVLKKPPLIDAGLSIGIRPTSSTLLARLREASAQVAPTTGGPKVRAQISDLVAGFSEHSEANPVAREGRLLPGLR